MLRIQLLGTLRIEFADKPITNLRGNRTRSLLTKLVLCCNKPVARSALASLLWPDSSDAQGRTNLRRELHAIRHAHIALENCIVVTREALLWKPGDACESDVELFLGQYDAFTNAATSDEKLAIGGQALDLYVGDLVQGLNDEWIESERSQLRDKWIFLLEQYIPFVIRARRQEAAISLLEKYLVACPFNERAYLQLMQVHLMHGNSALAQHAYYRCEKILQRELGIVPSAQLQELHQRLSKRINIDSPKSGVIPRQRKVSGGSFFGREGDLQKLVAEVNRVTREGGIHIIVVSGHSGIGKTRLIEELFKSEGVDRTKVPSAICHESQSGRPLHVAISLMKSETIDKDINSLEKSSQKILNQTLPELFLDAEIGGRPGSHTGEIAVTHMHSAMSEMMTGTSNRGVNFSSIESPLRLSFIDDIQWCDRDSLDWIHTLAASEQEKPFLLLLTRRTEEIGPGHPVDSLFLDFQSKGKLTELCLEPLIPQCSQQLVENELSDANGDISKIEVETICQSASGNPLFLLEMTRYRQSLGEDWAGNSGDLLSPRIHAIVQKRIGRLSAQAQSIVAIGATVGKSFSVELLQTVSGVTDEQLILLLEELWHAGLLSERAPGEYNFVHDCFREAGFMALTIPRRRSLHGRVATALEQINYFDSRAASAQIALHWYEAGKVSKAIEWYFTAMQYSSSVLAFQDVFRIGAIILQHLDHNNESIRSVEDRVRVLLLIAYARSITDGFGSKQVEKLCGQLEIYEKHVNDPVLAASIIRRLRMYYSFSSRPREALNYVSRQLQLAEQLDDSAGILESHRAKAFVELQLGRYEASIKSAKAACALWGKEEKCGRWDSRNPTWAFLMSHAIQAYGLHVHGKSNDAHRAFSKCHLIDFCEDDSHLKGMVLFWMGLYFQSCDDVKEAEQVGSRFFSIGDEFGVKKFEAYGNYFTGWAKLRAGEFEAALTLLEQSLEVYKPLDEHIMYPLLCVPNAEGNLAVGNLESARQVCSEALEYSAKYVMPVWNSEILRVQAKVISRSGGARQSVLQVYETAKKLNRKQKADLFLLRTLIDEYTYLTDLESSAERVIGELYRVYHRNTRHGKSAELLQAHHLLRNAQFVVSAE